MNVNQFTINYHNSEFWSYHIMGDPMKKLKYQYIGGFCAMFIFYLAVAFYYDLRIAWLFIVPAFMLLAAFNGTRKAKGVNGSMILQCNSGIINYQFKQYENHIKDVAEIVYVYTKKLSNEGETDEFVFIKLHSEKLLLVNHNRHIGDEPSDNFAKSLATTFGGKYSVLEVMSDLQCKELHLKYFARLRSES